MSLFHQINPRWDLLADITWTGWSDFEELAIYYKSGGLLSYTPEEWDDNLRYSLGVTYHLSEALKLRGGVAYDETPVSDTYRTPRIPDASRLWVAIGGQYRVSRQGVLDFGYAHLFVDDADLNSPAPGTIPFTPVLTGSYDNSVDIISFQYTQSSLSGQGRGPAKPSHLLTHRPAGAALLYGGREGSPGLSAQGRLDSLLGSRALEALTRATVTSRSQLRQELEKVRSQGFALDMEECEQGASCIAVPVRNGRGETVAAIGISGPSIRMDAQRMKELVPIVMRIGSEASEHLGFYTLQDSHLTS